ncbi:MAG: ATP-dependent DNA helicase RecG [Gloeomargaritaceae cyanobacterium C42_A2020_066]|nr:ATP-dependent DNA helicase RecG [Gloeomargaritaceae cyanobacterium C42_A2020_066]
MSKRVEWNGDRVQQALALEAKTGFTNLQGREYTFHDFLRLQLQQIPPDRLPRGQFGRWQILTTELANYPCLPPEARQDLLTRVRWLVEALPQTGRPAAVPPARPQVKEPAPAPPPSHTVTWEMPLDQVKVLKPYQRQQLNALGLSTLSQVLRYYPRGYVDYSHRRLIRDLQPGETVTVVGTIRSCQCFTSPKNPKLSILEVVVADPSGRLKLSRFFAGKRYTNRAWQEQQLRAYPRGATVAVSGLVKEGKYDKTLQEPVIEVIDGDETTAGRIIPIYPLKAGVKALGLRQTLNTVLPLTQQLPDPLPAGLCRAWELLPLGAALTQIHNPDSPDQEKAAKRRLVFDEFLYLQLAFLQRRHQQRAAAAATPAITLEGRLLEQFRQQLPFRFTTAQERVIQEILRDLQKNTPMQRLVQGDVGSGKTVVAVMALLAALEAGYQGALMAPTEVLAEQHYAKLVAWLTPLHLSVDLLTGSTRPAGRRQTLAQLETGELSLVVGTHALIQEDVNFQRLGLVVIDEQHRFGVAQRARLQQKGLDPHVLTMTATPIPRTLALTLHGDLDVSQIDELPPGRQPIQTTVMRASDRRFAQDLIRREVVQGRQAYIILPLVDESEKIELRSAIQEYERLREVVFPTFQLGLLHGRMSSAEKEEAIRAFRDHKTQILVSTTVVEVGVDVPNATVMMIEHAERFGLAQLHQLRGRVGRGSHKSYCLLISSNQNELSLQRLKVLEQSQDGFWIAEMDLRLRGPGEVLGTRQAGLPDLALASLMEDQEVLESARQAATQLMSQDPSLVTWPYLKQELDQRVSQLLGDTVLS